MKSVALIGVILAVFTVFHSEAAPMAITPSPPAGGNATAHPHRQQKIQLNAVRIPGHVARHRMENSPMGQLHAELQQKSTANGAVSLIYNYSSYILVGQVSVGSSGRPVRNINGSW
jgi:hypothetical protein